MSRKRKKQPNNSETISIKLTDEQILMCEQIYRKILCGTTLNEIATELGISKKRMSEEIEPLLISYLSIYIMKNSKVEKIKEMIAFFKSDHKKEKTDFESFFSLDQPKRKFILKTKLYGSKCKYKTEEGYKYNFDDFDPLQIDVNFNLKKDEIFKFFYERNGNAIRKSADENNGKQYVNGLSDNEIWQLIFYNPELFVFCITSIVITYLLS